MLADVNDENDTTRDADDLPNRLVTVNQVVAWNIAWYRRAAGLTQKELGERIGWSNVSISEAERSWDGKRTREFDAQTIIELAVALGVPVGALFLPPTDDGTEARYLFTTNAGTGDEPMEMADLMALVMPDSDNDAPAINVYRGRLHAAVGRYLDESWGPEVDRWLERAAGPELRADRAARIRMRRDVLREIADEYGELADIVEEGSGS